MATHIKQTKSKRIPGRGWITYVLLDDPTAEEGVTVFALSTFKYPCWDELADIENTGHRTPPVVARHYFPEIFTTIQGFINPHKLTA